MESHLECRWLNVRVLNVIGRNKMLRPTFCHPKILLRFYRCVCVCACIVRTKVIGKGGNEGATDIYADFKETYISGIFFSLHTWYCLLPHCVTKFQCLSKCIRANRSFDLFSMRLKNCVKGLFFMRGFLSCYRHMMHWNQVNKQKEKLNFKSRPRNGASNETWATECR